MKRLAWALLLPLAACASERQPAGPGPLGGPVDCTNAQAPIVPGSTLAFLEVPPATLASFAVSSSTGCWVRVGEVSMAGPAVSLSVDPSGRFLYASTRVEPRRTGVEAFRIDGPSGRLEPIGRFPLETDWWETPGRLVATGDSVYAITQPPGTGYHGGFWRFSIDRVTGRLDWRGNPYPAREPLFVEWSPARAALFVWMEDLRGPPHTYIRSLRIGPDGSLALASEVPVPYGFAEADPTGDFLWMANDDEGATGSFARLDVFATPPGGALRPTAALDWRRRPPVAHPGGRVLYAASATGLESFIVDPGTGAPSPAAAAPVAAGLQARLAVDPSGTFVYSVTADEVQAYRTNQAGALQPAGRLIPGGGAVVLSRVH